MRVGPIVVTTDLPPLLCVAEDSQLALSFRVSGGTPNQPLQYRWFHNGAIVGYQTSDTLRIARSNFSAAGQYYVEVWCHSQSTAVNTAVKSSVVKVRVVRSVMDKVNKILLEHARA